MELKPRLMNEDSIHEQIQVHGPVRHEDTRRDNLLLKKNDKPGTSTLVHQSINVSNTNCLT